VANDGKHQLFAVAPPGLEATVAAELAGLGIYGTAIAGGVTWSGGPESLYLANLQLRSASRILVRVASFSARSFIELERHARRIDWTPYIEPGTAVTLRVSSAKSRLFHEGAISERFARYLVESAGVKVDPPSPSGESPDEFSIDESSCENVEPAAHLGGAAAATGSPGGLQAFVVRFHRDRCVVSADSSGALLHRRGYRQAVAKAPLRETLAAAALLTVRWVGREPLLDPFCGSGTIPIEAALIARRIPPGLAGRDREPRAFAFQRWPSFQAAHWEKVVAGARTAIVTGPLPVIRASDRDAGAVEAARRNALRAGVEEDIDFAVQPLSAVQPPAELGWLVTNPPYGVRVGERAALRNLYAALGRFARERLPGWGLAIFSADDRLARVTGIQWREALRTSNGGIPVRLLLR
jgi:putative N6-adenine-specific DNA methylase